MIRILKSSDMKQITLCLLLLLSACATPEEIEAARQAQMQADYDTCVDDYGFKPKSDAARNCMLQLQIAREQINEVNSRPYYGYGYPYRAPGAGVHYYIGH